jgi:Mg2+/Co2+ transporter CorC
MLNATQHDIEHNYYMIDIAEIAQQQRRKNAVNRLELLQLINSSQLEKEDYKELVNGLMRTAEIKPQEEKFSRSKMDALHAFTAAMK